MTILPDEDREALRAAILARYRSPYAFWKENRERICKSAVVLVLKGTYPGNQVRQAERMRELLAAPRTVSGPRVPGAEEIMEALERVACARCPRRSRKSRTRCRGCRAVWQAQAAEIGRLYHEPS